MSTTTTAPRARRRPPAERRALIAAAARTVALEGGLSAVTLRAVASRAGVTPALVAHYVPSMEDLVSSTFSAVVRAELDDIVILASHGTAVPRLLAVLHTLMDPSRDDVTLVWVDAWALGRHSEPLAAAVRDQMDRWQGALADIISAGVAEGAFRVGSPVDAAWQLLGMIDGLNAQALVRWGRASDRTALLSRAVEGMLGLAPGALGAEPLSPLDQNPPEDP